MLFLRRSHETASQDTATQGSMTEPPVDNENDPRVEMIDGMPHYPGRPLERPEDEVQDQGLSFDLQTLVSRRSALSALGLGATAFGLAACAPTSRTSAAARRRRMTDGATAPASIEAFTRASSAQPCTMGAVSIGSPSSGASSARATRPARWTG